MNHGNTKPHCRTRPHPKAFPQPCPSRLLLHTISRVSTELMFAELTLTLCIKVFSSSYDGPFSRTPHHCRSASDSTYLTRATFESHHRSPWTTSVSPPQGASFRTNASFTNPGHSTRYFCPDVACDTSIGNPSDLKRHILTKHEGKVQICTSCRRSFYRGYNHNTCNGVRSSFETTPLQRNGWGCGLCLEYFHDFDKWVRHIVVHQKKENKQKADWDISLHLRSLLQNPELVDTPTYSSSHIASMTWQEENYEEVKRILETTRYRSPDQLQKVFDLASPVRAQTPYWPAPNPSQISTGAGSPPNQSPAFDDELAMSEATSDTLQLGLHVDLPSEPHNFGWERRATSPQRTESTLRKLEEEIAGDDESSYANYQMASAIESQVPTSYSNYLELCEDDRNSLSDIFVMSDIDGPSYFENALGDHYGAAG